jgi:predicted ArsR family transcriptional regulator
MDTFDSRVTRIAALGEPVRRALYRYVASQADPVSRDQAAEGLGVPRHVAKFHLDRLVEDGLLDVEYKRPPGRGGPGAGRPAKLYRRAAGEVAVSLPERRYDLAGWLLARAVNDAEREDVSVAEALGRAARESGRALGEEARLRAGRRPGRATLLEAAREVLEERGYEPLLGESGMTLANCPFHLLAREYTDLVCGMNLDLIQGFLSGLGEIGLDAVLDPGPDRCCVCLRPGASGSRSVPRR